MRVAKIRLSEILSLGFVLGDYDPTDGHIDLGGGDPVAYEDELVRAVSVLLAEECLA